MPRDNSFKDYIVEDVLGHIPGITSKAMFSGHGIYLDGVIVGLIIDGTFYLKADAEARERYEKEGCEPFAYEREPKGKARAKVVTMSYMSVPEETMEDREKMEERIYESFEISKKAKNRKT
jgi:DNA transformation protein